MDLAFEKLVGKLPLLLGLVLAGAVVFGGCTKSQQAQVDQVANTMMADSNQEMTTSTTADERTATTAGGSYVPYSKTAFDGAADKQRVYFFHASWCPTCKAADKDLTQNVDQIPPEVVVFKTDYDEETELKEQYDITYQHTFVQVDEQGNELTKWNGGGAEQISENII